MNPGGVLGGGGVGDWGEAVMCLAFPCSDAGLGQWAVDDAADGFHPFSL